MRNDIIRKVFNILKKNRLVLGCPRSTIKKVFYWIKNIINHISNQGLELLSRPCYKTVHFLTINFFLLFINIVCYIKIIDIHNMQNKNSNSSNNKANNSHKKYLKVTIFFEQYIFRNKTNIVK